MNALCTTDYTRFVQAARRHQHSVRQATEAKEWLLRENPGMAKLTLSKEIMGNNKALPNNMLLKHVKNDDLTKFVRLLKKSTHTAGQIKLAHAHALKNQQWDFHKSITDAKNNDQTDQINWVNTAAVLLNHNQWDLFTALWNTAPPFGQSDLRLLTAASFSHCPQGVDFLFPRCHLKKDTVGFLARAAAATGHLAQLEVIRKKTPDIFAHVSRACFKNACCNGQTSMVSTLLPELELDNNEIRLGLEWCCLNGHHDTAAFLLNTNTLKNDLYHAVYWGLKGKDPNIVKKFLGNITKSERKKIRDELNTWDKELLGVFDSLITHEAISRSLTEQPSACVSQKRKM